MNAVWFVSLPEAQKACSQRHQLFLVSGNCASHPTSLLHHNSIIVQHTYNPESQCTNQKWTIQGQNKLSWDEPNKSVINLEYVANILIGKNPLKNLSEEKLRGEKTNLKPSQVLYKITQRNEVLDLCRHSN